MFITAVKIIWSDVAEDALIISLLRIDDNWCVRQPQRTYIWTFSSSDETGKLRKFSTGKLSHQTSLSARQNIYQPVAFDSFCLCSRSITKTLRDNNLRLKLSFHENIEWDDNHKVDGFLRWNSYRRRSTSLWTISRLEMLFERFPLTLACIGRMLIYQSQEHCSLRSLHCFVMNPSSLSMVVYDKLSQQSFDRLN